MQDVALVFGLITILGGVYMAGVLMRVGRPFSGATTTRLSPAVVFSHGTVAVIGVGVWMVYMSYQDKGLAWASIGLLVVAVLIGTVMFLQWLKGKHGPVKETGGDRHRLAEQQISSVVVHGHGLLAAVTILFAVLVALGIGD